MSSEGNMNVLPMPDPKLELADRIQRHVGLLTVAEVVPLLGFKRTTIYDMCRDGRIPYLRFGDSVRFDPMQLADWVREHYVPAAA